MQRKNLSFNRSNIANIYLNKKGQAVQVQLKNQQQPQSATIMQGSTQVTQESGVDSLAGTQGPAIFAQSVSTKIRGNSLEPQGNIIGGTKKSLTG